MRQVKIFDTTLRDGEQSPGASMTSDEKLDIARVLSELNVDIIEAGFAIASQGDFDAIHQISQEIDNAEICSLCRANRHDIDRALEALAPAAQPRIHVFISTSHIHMKYKLRLSPDQVVESIDSAVRYARRYCDNVEWSCEDGTRSDIEFLKRCFDTAIRAGATTVNIADTVGYIMPRELQEIVRTLRESVPGMDGVDFSVHCHDDLGMATANSLAAIEAGATQVECSINSLGERAGNASLEEITMALKTRSALLGAETRVDTRHLQKASSLVSAITGFPVPPNKAIVGRNVFAHESGIHQHGVLQNRLTYEIMRPEDIGFNESTIVLGKHSGRHGLRAKLLELGLNPGDNAFETVFTEFKKLADTGAPITDDALHGLVRRFAADDIRFATRS
jgi:2-isopropylmalate synthase